ncbi:hypothetical protein [Methyloligella solikamskensis]|uniref:Uncharacterized protein n=1 Tax=Methyloligella solikamskensis TaxID=1177756 RepID=A0ABW3J9R0_9HYPH
MTAALGLGFAAVPAAAAPGAATATSIQSSVPAGVTQVGVRGCGLFDRRCRRGGADFRLRAPGVGVYIDGDRDRYRHRYDRHHRYDRDRRWKRRWRY